MPRSLEALEAHVTTLGVTVEYHPLTGHGLFGYYMKAANLIVINNAAPPAYQVYTLAHELGHAYQGHECDTGYAEHYADLYAAELLIKPAAYKAAEAEADGNPVGIAHLLELPLPFIEFYRERLTTKIAA